jgi:hypothetical protein
VTLTAADLKDLSPFLAVVVSMLALTVGPSLAHMFARAQASAAMRERRLLAFRECLTELITEFDVLHEFLLPRQDGGMLAAPNYEQLRRKLRTLINRAELMCSPSDPSHVQLIDSIQEVFNMLVNGIDGNDYGPFHDLSASVRKQAQAVIASEWKKLAA